MKLAAKTLYVTLTSLAILLCFTQGLRAQSSGAVAGRVTNAGTGEPLPGASVGFANMKLGTAADDDGRFRLVEVPAGTHTLVVSYVGFHTQKVEITVTADETVEQDVALESKVLETGEVVVEGIRRGQLQSLSREKNAVRVMDVISADEVGKLPDDNVAEAVQRIAGVSIQTDKGQGRFVTIRGSSPELNNVTLNGNILASTADTRATALDLLPASMVSSVEVTKAVTPDMAGNAVGGTINVSTLSALDRNQSFLFGTFEGLAHTQQTSFYDYSRPYRASVTGGSQFGSDESFGVVVSAFAERKDYSWTTVGADGWERIDGAPTPGGFKTEMERTARERYGVNANVEFRPSQRTHAYLDVHYSATEQTDSKYEQNVNSAEELVSEAGRSGRVEAGYVLSRYDLQDDDEYLTAVTLGGEQEFGALTWNADATYTRGVLNHSNRNPKFYGINESFFETGNLFREDFSGTYDGNGVPTFTPDNPEALSNTEEYIFGSVDTEDGTNTENTYAFSTDLRWDVKISDYSGFLKTGGSARVRDKVVDNAEFEYVPADGMVMTLAEFARQPPAPLQRGADVYAVGDGGEFFDYFEQNRNNTDIFVENAEKTPVDAIINDSDNRESVYAGYLMGQVEVGGLTAVGGARVEATSTETKRYQKSESDETDAQDITRQTYQSSYATLLPDVLLRYEATDNLLFRAAWTNTIGRPDYDELSAYRDVSYFETGDDVFQGVVSSGNPDLDPYRAMNLEAAAEYYVGSAGLLSAGVFYKRVDNPIYRQRTEEEDIEFEGRQYSRLVFSQLKNGEAGSIRGLELTYQQPLLFLPSFFSGLGVVSNLTVTDSEVEISMREGEELPFEGQTDLLYNIIPYYQIGPFQARVALNYRGKRLVGIGEEAFEDQYEEPRQTIDVGASYSVDEVLGGAQFTIRAQVKNLTNEPLVSYTGTPDRINDHTLWGRTFSLGVSTSF